MRKKKYDRGFNKGYLAGLAETGLSTLKKLESGRGNITLNDFRKIIDVLDLEIRLEVKNHK